MAKRQGMVYVIDDDQSVRNALLGLFSSVNLTGKGFSSTEEFLSDERRERNACILIDLRVLGSTGFDLQKSLTSQGIEIPVIVISASDDLKNREHARELGAVGFFRKPVDDQALLDAVWWAITGHSKNG